MNNPSEKLTPYQQFLRANPEYVGFGPYVYRKDNGLFVGVVNPIASGFGWLNTPSGMPAVHPSAIKPDWWKMK